MMGRKNLWLRRLMLLMPALLLAACGGSGGDIRTSGVVDPAPSYTGATTQATVSAGNAESLALGGYGGSGIAATVGNFSLAAKGADSRPPAGRPALQAAEALKQAARRMDIPAKARQQLAKGAGGAAKTVQRTVTHQTPGDGGGQINYTLEVNDSVGSIFGTLDFQDYTSRGIAISGRAEMLGTFDASRQQLTRLTLSFKSLTMSGSGFSFGLIGTLSWGFNYTAATESLSINMVLVNNADSRTYWFRDYELTTTYGTTVDGALALTQTVAGRYYDPDYGYVDFTTLSPLLIPNGSSWPSQGALQFTGQQGGRLYLSFSADTLQVEADTDGNGSAEWQTRRQTNITPATNVTPVANAGPDQSVSQWATVLLDGSASSDANNDPITYSWSFASCPQGACPALAGSTTATPSFTAELAGTYQLRLSVYDGQSYGTADTVDVTVTPAAASAPNLLQEQWQYGLYGTSIGRAGLFATDLDGDGDREIIASASSFGFGYNSYWYVARQAPGGGYEQVWRSRQYGTTVVQLILADLTGDGRDDIVVGLADGTVYVYDGPTRQELRKLATTGTLAALAVADLDGDGSREIVASDGTGVFVYAADGSGLLWSLASGGGSSVAVGNVDADGGVEIVTTGTGGKGYVIDGLSHAVEWEYVNGFGARVALADLDGDGMQEIAGAAAWYKITVFDGDRRTPAWEITTGLDIGSLLLADTNADGVPEILYGDSQWGKIHAVDARSRRELWAVDNPEHGVSGIALADVDQDGQPELLWGAGGSSTGPDHLYVASPATGTIEWQSTHVDGPLSAVAVGDVDDDGADEIVMVSYGSNSGYGEGIIHIFDARTHVLEYQEKLGLRDWMGVRSVRIGDVDDDGRTEFVVTTGDIYDGVIRVYDGASHTLERESAGYGGNFFSALAIGDVDGDGRTEIVAGQGKEHTGATGVYLIVYDGATLQEKWRSIDLGGGWNAIYDIELADLDGDGHAEICASVAGSRLVVFDGVNHDLKLLIEHPARALAVADVDGDGGLELLAGRTDGRIDVFNGTTFALKRSVASFGKSSIDALRLADLDGDAGREWLVAGGGLLTVLEGEGQGLKWRSRDLTGNLGAYNHLEIRDTDGDGRPELFVGADFALYQFEPL